MSKTDVSLYGAAALGGAATIYAMFNVLIREMSNMYGDQAQIVARYSLALLILIMLQIFWHKKSITVPAKRLWYIVLLGIVVSAAVFFITTAVNTTSIANAVFMIWAGSIITSFILGTVILREKITINKTVALLLVLVGLGMFAQDFWALSLGLIAGFAAGASNGIANLLRKNLKDIPRNTLLVYQYTIGSVLLTVFMFSSGNDIIREISLLGIGVTVLYAILLVFLGNLLLCGFQHFDVNVGTIILATEIIISILLGYLFFNEIPTAKELLGGLAIFLAAITLVLNVSPRKAIQ